MGFFDLVKEYDGKRLAPNRASQQSIRSIECPSKARDGVVAGELVHIETNDSFAVPE